MGLIAGRDLKDAGLDLDKTLFVEKAARRLGDRSPRQQERLSIGMPGRRPPWRRLVRPGHQPPPCAIGDEAIADTPIKRLRKSSYIIDIIRFNLSKNPNSERPRAPRLGVRLVHVERRKQCPSIAVADRYRLNVVAVGYSNDQKF